VIRWDSRSCRIDRHPALWDERDNSHRQPRLLSASVKPSSAVGACNRLAGGCNDSENGTTTPTTEKTVRELALENPAATRVFEKLGIDYCCGGNKSLDEACRAANLNTNQVLDSLEMAGQSARAVQEGAQLADRSSG
jgi:hypothetical protein